MYVYIYKICTHQFASWKNTGHRHIHVQGVGGRDRSKLLTILMFLYGVPPPVADDTESEMFLLLAINYMSGMRHV